LHQQELANTALSAINWRLAVMKSDSALSTLGINSQVLSFFAPYIKSLESKSGECSSLLQGCQQNDGLFRELTSLYHPLGKVTWLAGGEYPILIRNLYLFYSPIEAMCFAHCHHGCLARPDQVVLAAVGLCPTAAQIHRLLGRYPRAKVHVVFPADIPGKVADCKVALWAKERDGKFSFKAGKLLVSYQSTNYEFHEDGFSLSKFEKQVKLNSLVRAHKPKSGFLSFFQLLKDHQRSGYTT
jgi:hypothetical protein